MQLANFSLDLELSDNDHDVITIDESDMRVIAFKEINLYRRDPDEITLYGNNAGQPIAFESSKWTEADLVLFTAAIHWYASEILNNPIMEVSIVDPRPPFKLHIVR
ncbi:hypothetical protein [Mucilaginibacter sp.]|uniref:hypothetical protein n=1 Tax=Mucilaginibacter sp. TaxID=1882438 RepID=UPI0035BC852D